jgi:ribosomal protein S18 acetylase RimI-like enzyme
MVWALNDLPNIGATADPAVPLPLPPATGPPANFADLADITGYFLNNGGEFLVAEQDGHLVGMGGIRPSGQRRAEVLRVRVHPAARRRGVGRALMAALERRAGQLGLRELHLDMATNQRSDGLLREPRLSGSGPGTPARLVVDPGLLRQDALRCS